MTGERIERENLDARTSPFRPRRLQQVGCTVPGDPVGEGAERAARRIEARETPMHVQHQFLLDVLDLYPRQGRSNARGMMANTTDDPGIDTGVVVCRSHLLLHVVVAEKGAASGLGSAGQPAGSIGQRSDLRCSQRVEKTVLADETRAMRSDSQKNLRTERSVRA